MIVALYARVSTDKQDEQLQLPRLREYAARMGFEVFREYSERLRAKTATAPDGRHFCRTPGEKSSTQ